MAAEIVRCPRCGSAPALEKKGSYWRVKCPNHTGLLILSAVGHTMKTQKAAIAEWNRVTAEPAPSIGRSTSRGEGG